MLYTAAPSTCPTGTKPTDLIAANSSVLSADPQVPLALISSSLACAACGNPSPDHCDVTASAPDQLSAASHSSLRRRTVSSARSAACLVGYGPSRSFAGQTVSDSTVWCLTQNHQCCSLSL